MPSTPKSVEAGRKLFQQDCKVGPRFDMKSWKSKMTDTDVWSVVNYLRSIGPKTGAP